MAKNDIGDLLSEYIGQFGEGGGVDLADCAVGALCAQTDIEAANFMLNVNHNLPQPLKKIGAELQIVEDNKGTSYGYKIGVDVSRNHYFTVHEYKGEPIKKIFNIWNYGTGDGKIPRTMFWSKAIRKLKNKYNRADERFMQILNARYQGHISHAPNTGASLEAKEQHYKQHKGDYMSSEEKAKVALLNESSFKLTGK